MTRQRPAPADDLLAILCRPVPRPEPDDLAAWLAHLQTRPDLREDPPLAWLLERGTQTVFAAPGQPRRGEPTPRASDDELLALLVELADDTEHWDIAAWLFQTVAPSVCEKILRCALRAGTDHLVIAWVAEHHADEILAVPEYFENPFELTGDECVLVNIANIYRSHLARGDARSERIRIVLGRIEQILRFVRSYVALLTTAPRDRERRERVLPELLEASAVVLGFGVDVRVLVSNIESNYLAHCDPDISFDYSGCLTPGWTDAPAP